MQRLSGLDAFFLYLESPTQPLNVCCVLELDPATMPGGYDFARFREALAERVDAVPEFRLKLADNQLNFDHPVWVDDDRFDLGRHLHRVALPSPGGREELAEICGHVAGLALDRDRPLWEMWVIEGLRGGDALSVVLKAHHAVVDGVGGANLRAQLCGPTPDGPPPPPEPAARAGAANPLQIAAGGLIGAALRPWRLARVVPATALTLAQTVLRARGGGHTMAAPFAAPPTAFNGHFTRRRNIALASVDLEDVKTVKQRFGVTVNDVVTAMCAGALRQYLLDRDALPDIPMVASVPVSVRGKSSRPGRNQMTWMLCRLETHIADPAERLTRIAGGNAAAKDHAAAMGPTLLQDWTQVAGQTMFGAAMKLLPRIPLPEKPPHNLVMSNVAGPRDQLYFLGCRLDAMYPLGPIIAGAGLNITVMSLGRRLGVGIISCPDLVADLWDLADAFPVALKELMNSSAPVRGRT
ncbi:acyltransferase [Mycobacterium intracellulare subsp. yongonense 05-1390]|uniref:Diacylglycerol O-acyltransferase n=2 Tax=Mycobacterium intracellulare TaxID=1767 RepID=A0AAE4UF87_MYCIT|nr:MULTISPECIES: wax ester/triacylglycerol synthase family O-acyltransferase [Mycobacterium avium complex (MAC)]AFS14562.1 Acyltransferase, ws/dgat/mgat subfamily protein' [Mycobacterium intracellulare subsp. intracellulare MTCC 9506]AGP64229.1 acyltransferase [Mycobacterium intracellulare subsp. yongonense 05-1390]MCA2319679.1 wax ester/triacylglycerol synthase family O-acyltransferase [Mycobacterium intracellulare]MCA2340192.1 wax ester/triacylglycerol synthase family O-acyltransferase [Mycob